MILWSVKNEKLKENYEICAEVRNSFFSKYKFKSLLFAAQFLFRKLQVSQISKTFAQKKRGGQKLPSPGKIVELSALW